MRKIFSTIPLLISLVVAPAVPAAAVTPDEDPAAAAAGWLVEQYQDHPDTFGFNGGAGDIADLIFALAGARVGADFADDTLLPALEAVVADYVATGTAALAKTILAVTAAGGDVTSFGGLDLGQLLEDAYDDATGEFTPGDFGVNAFDQALAMLAWAATGQPMPTAAADRLRDLACDDGQYGFDCPGGAGDIDSTALAVQALLAAGEEAEAAVLWLLDQQQDDGSFHAFGAPSHNSTGVATMTLRAADETAAADAGAAWMTTQQAGCGSEDAGSIGDPETVFSVESATMQGLLAFEAPRYDELDLSAAASEVPVVCDLVLEPVTDTSGDDTAAPNTDVADEAGALADTGSSNAWLVLVAALLVLAGVGLLRLPVRDER